jgi:hypothetical protein
MRLKSVDFRLPNATNGTEAFLELINAALGVHKLGEAGEEWMRIGSDADRDHAVLNAVNDFLFVGGLSGAADETLASGHIYKDDRIVFRMKVLFHEIRGPTTFPTQRDAEGGENHRPVKPAN